MAEWPDAHTNLGIQIRAVTWARWSDQSRDGWHPSRARLPMADGASATKDGRNNRTPGGHPRL